MRKVLLLLVLLPVIFCAAPLPAAESEGAAVDEEATLQAAPTKKAAKPEAEVLDEMLVKTQREEKQQDEITIKSAGLPAKVTVLTGDDLQEMPVMHWTDMIRAVPGVQISKYTGATPPAISMRGFKSWRCSDIGVFIDGVPMNQAQSAMNGQVDLGWLIPEMIERIEVIKGPFSALYGNFALAGAINIVTKKADKSPSIAGYAGNYDTYRGVAVISDPDWKPTPFLVYEGYSQNGYQINSQSYRYNLFNKISYPMLGGDVSFRAHYWYNDYMDPGMLSENKVRSGEMSRKAAIGKGPSDTSQFDLVLNYTPNGGETGFHGSVFYNRYQFNSIYPSNSVPNRYDDQYDVDYIGWKLLYDYRPFETLSLVFGNDLQYEMANGEGRMTTPDTVLSTYYHSDVDQFSTGFFAQAQYRPFSFIKLIGGLRYDIFNIDVDNKLNPENSGTATPSVFSPKIGLVITPYKGINIFANRGEGFRSPSASELSPSSGPKNFDLDIPQVETWDVGFNALLFERAFIGFDYYNTQLESEVWYNSTTNTYENLGDSDREGYEIEAKLFITNWLTLYGSYAHVRARIKNPQTEGANYIPNLSPDISTVGFEINKTWSQDYRLGVDAYWLYYAGSPMTSDGEVNRPPFDRYLTKLTFGYKKWTASLDVALTPRTYSTEYMTYSSDTGYWFVPYPKWEILAGLKYQF